MERLTINNKIINHTNQGTLLGLKLQSSGIIGHIAERVKQGNIALAKL